MIKRVALVVSVIGVYLWSIFLSFVSIDDLRLTLAPFIAINVVLLSVDRVTVNSQVAYLLLLLSSVMLISGVMSIDGLVACVYLYTFYLLFNRREYVAILLKSVVAKAILFLVLAPLEIQAMGKQNLSELQFTGGQYYNIGALILVLIVGYGVLNKFWIRTVIVTLYVTILMSFSRGALLIFPLVILATFRLDRKTVPFLVILCCGLYVRIKDTFFLEYWRLRLNLTSSSVEGLFSSSSRHEIIDVYWDNVDIFHFLFGYGIGGIKSFMTNSTKGIMQFGSLHNFVMNSIGEIGLFGFISLITVIAFKAFRYGRRELLLILSFFLFGLTTGLELMNMSRNFSMDIFMLILIL